MSSGVSKGRAGQDVKAGMVPRSSLEPSYGSLGCAPARACELCRRPRLRRPCPAATAPAPAAATAAAFAEPARLLLLLPDGPPGACPLAAPLCSAAAPCSAATIAGAACASAPSPAAPLLLAAAPAGADRAAGRLASFVRRSSTGRRNRCCRSLTPARASRRRDAAYCWSRLRGREGGGWPGHLRGRLS